MDKKELTISLDHLSELLGCARGEALEYALTSAINSLEAGRQAAGVSAAAVLGSAEALLDVSGGFTMDELIDSMSKLDVVCEPHKTKMFAARVLRTAGFARKQCRRGRDRPLLWWRVQRRMSS